MSPACRRPRHGLAGRRLLHALGERCQQRVVELRGLDRLRELHGELSGRRTSGSRPSEVSRTSGSSRSSRWRRISRARASPSISGITRSRTATSNVLALLDQSERLGGATRLPRPPCPTIARAGPRSRGSWRCRPRRGSACRRAAAGPLCAATRVGTSPPPRGQADVERRSLALLALHPHRPAHQLDEALRDREPEPGTAVAAGGRGVDLAERREQPVHPVLRDADPGVPNGEAADGTSSRPAGSASTWTTTSPSSVNLTAFESRLSSTCRRRVASPTIPAGTSSSMRQPSSISFSHGARRDDVERALDALAEIERLLARARACPPRSSRSRGCRRSRGAARLRSSGRPRRTRAAPASAPYRAGGRSCRSRRSSAS